MSSLSLATDGMLARGVNPTLALVSLGALVTEQTKPTTTGKKRRILNLPAPGGGAPPLLRPEMRLLEFDLSHAHYRAAAAGIGLIEASTEQRIAAALALLDTRDSDA